MTSTNDADAPQVPVKPPVVLAVLLGVGAVLQWRFPIGGGVFSGDGWFALGLLIAGGGIVLASAAARSFIEAGTTFMPDRPNAALVVTGLYQHTRNPMYIGLITVYLGLALVIGLWPLLLLPAFVYYLRYHAIGPEEAYLQRRFGEPYRDYMERVPRWI